MVLEHFPFTTMSQLISSIDPILAFYVIIGVVASVASFIMMKLHIPDSERYPKHR
jgi:hypothetical protein